MKLFSKSSAERETKQMKEAIPFMKKIKFFSQREIDDEDYLELSKKLNFSSADLEVLSTLLNRNLLMINLYSESNETRVLTKRKNRLSGRRVRKQTLHRPYGNCHCLYQ